MSSVNETHFDSEEISRVHESFDSGEISSVNESFNSEEIYEVHESLIQKRFLKRM